MPPSTNPPSPFTPSRVRRLRIDQIRAIQSLLVVALGALFLALYHTVWPASVVGAVAIGSAVLLGVSGYFWGRFHVGQNLLLESSASEPTRATPPVPDHKLQAYASLDDARQHGWTFFDLCGRHGAQPIPRWAHDGQGWFEYDGLDTGKSASPYDQRRVFGRLVYLQAAQAPASAATQVPLVA